MEDHDYDSATFLGAGDEGSYEMADVEPVDHTPKAGKINLDHTPIKNPLSKKQKKGCKSSREDCIGDTILEAVNALASKMDTQTELLKKFEKRITENSAAIVANKEHIVGLQEKVNKLQEENKRLKESILEQARYKRKWNLRLNGLPEKQGEDTREMVIGILTRVIPVSVE